jgi:lipoprotein NlpD
MLMGVVLMMTGCGTSRPLTSVPVENRGTSATSAGVAMSAPESPDAKQLPGAENAGKPGYYSVRPGDTIIRIGLDTGQNWRDIVRWNNLENPNLIEVGQVLRVVAPTTAMAAGTTGAASSSAPTPAASESGGVVTRPVTSGSVVMTTPNSPSAPASAASRPASAAGAASAPNASAPSPAASAAPLPPLVTSAPPSPAPVPSGDENVGWIWPAPGAVVARFDEATNKGLDIAGRAGDPVIAAADGRVVYAGAGLRGYGNLVILKHNNTFLTAYAHNQTLLVKEDQAVKKGQKIAEMGSSDADRVKLHFEIRRQGKPVDPSRYLPAR